MFCFAHTLCGQIKPTPEHQVKADYLLNFTRFVNWPPETFVAPNSPFIIGIMGNDPFGSYLDDIVAGERVGEHPIQVQRYNDLADVGNCQVLFIDTGDPERTKELIAAFEGESVLTVGDVESFADWGGDICFFKEHKKLRIKINLAAAKAAHLEISSKLLRIAKIY